MMMKTVYCLIVLLVGATGLACPAMASTAQQETIHQAQIEARIIVPPQALTGSDGQRHMAYELHITSYYGDDKPLKLVSLSVFADGDTKPVMTVTGAAIDALLSQSAQDAANSDGVPFASGQSRTLFLWLTLPKGSHSRSLRHQLDFRTPGGDLERTDHVRTPVVETAPITIGAPLRGGRWLAVEGPGNHLSHHWGSLVAIDGALTVPQRFATDWFGLDDSNHSVHGQHDSLTATTDADWVGYGSDVLAVADGVVVDARDGIPNGTPLSPETVPDDLTARTLYGNFVILEIAPHIYAHYAHLQTGTVGVKIGDHVRRGTVIGHLGQTGSAGAPHLHFHISDQPTFEESEGLPFVINAFVLRGQGSIEETFDPSKPAAFDLPTQLPRRAEMPLDGNVVSFP